MKAKKSSVVSVKAEAMKSVSAKPRVADAKLRNLEKLMKSGILENFISGKNGSWDHHGWLNLCDEISLNGFCPVDFDQVGMILEKEKEIYNKSQLTEDARNAC